jgi:uncharacterized protein DUF6544
VAVLSDLPTPLHTLAERVPDSAGRQVEIRQPGQMRLKPGGRAMAFTAVQQLAVDRVAFSWKARFRSSAGSSSASSMTTTEAQES